ncbi:MAG: hypothetical protein ACRCV6_00200 [Formosimonas sp.]
MQQINQNHSNTNPNTKPSPLASEQVRVVQKNNHYENFDAVSKASKRCKELGYKPLTRSEIAAHCNIAYSIFGDDLKRHRSDVNFTVELVDGSIWIPSTANLRVIAPTYQCIHMPDTLQPRRAPILLVSNGKHSSIGAYASDYATSLEV